MPAAARGRPFEIYPAGRATYEPAARLIIKNVRNIKTMRSRGMISLQIQYLSQSFSLKRCS
jgi:hypothetical protein